MQVLQEGVSKQILILRMPNNGGNGLNAGQLRGTPTTLAHDEFVASLWLPGNRRRQRPNNNGLKNSDFANRSCQFLKLFFVEYISRLSRIRDYLVEGELRVGGAGNLNEAFVRLILLILGVVRILCQNVVAVVSPRNGVTDLGLVVVLQIAVLHAAAALGFAITFFDKADILCDTAAAALCNVTGLRLINP